MFEGLKKKWNVGPQRLFFIILSFALGGTACGVIGKQIMKLTGLEKNFIYFFIYIVVITLLWPFCVIIISSIFGEYVFFKKYVSALLHKITGNKKKNRPAIIALFASGSGSNAKKIIEYFKDHESIDVSLVVCNKKRAGVLEIAACYSLPTLMVDSKKLSDPEQLLPFLKQHKISHIVLAGFLLKIPSYLIKAYQSKIINIHPSLLPAYGGRGMYGHHVHEGVIAAGETITGCTIHEVDEWYDHGKILQQATCPVLPNDSAETLAARVLEKEHKHYAPVIEKWISKS